MFTYLNTKIASIDIITEEQIARVSRWTTHLEQLHEIVELSVHVTTHRDRCLNIDHRLLEPEELGTFVDDPERYRLLDSALQYEVFLEDIDAWLAPAIENFGAR